MLFFYLTFYLLWLYLFFILYFFCFSFWGCWVFIFLIYNFYWFGFCFSFLFQFLSQILFQFYSFSLFFNDSLFVHVFYNFFFTYFFLSYFLYRSYYYIYSFEISVIHGLCDLFINWELTREKHMAHAWIETLLRCYSIVSDMSLCTMLPLPLRLIGETILHVSFGKVFCKKHCIPHLSVPSSRQSRFSSLNLLDFLKAKIAVETHIKEIVKRSLKRTAILKEDFKTKAPLPNVGYFINNKWLDISYFIKKIKSIYTM